MSDRTPNTATGLEGAERKHKVFHILHSKVVQNGMYITDMLFVEDVPTLVLEWGDVPDGEFPDVSIPLNPQFLQSVQGEEKFDYVYEHPVVDPRSEPGPAPHNSAED